MLSLPKTTEKTKYRRRELYEEGRRKRKRREVKDEGIEEGTGVGKR
jgi:hypothetical protein